MTIFDLVSKITGLEFYESLKYICLKFGISYKGSDIPIYEKVDTSFFEKFKQKEEQIELPILDKRILNSYYDLYHKSWIDEGISVETMKRFGIKFSILDNQIIIPHYDIDGNLIGVRVRNLDPQTVKNGKKYMPAIWKDKILNHPTGAALYGLHFTKKYVEKYKTIILFESEKSVLQLDSMFPDMSIGAAVSGSNFTYQQLSILRQLDIEEVVIGLDKEFEEINTEEEKYYAKKIQRIFVDKLYPYYRVSVIWDTQGLLSLKDSPTDRGPQIFQSLFENRIRL
jgi:hypothetical protein